MIWFTRFALFSVLVWIGFLIFLVVHFVRGRKHADRVPAESVDQVAEGRLRTYDRMDASAMLYDAAKGIMIKVESDQDFRSQIPIDVEISLRLGIQKFEAVAGDLN